MTSTNGINWPALVGATSRTPKQTFIPEDRPRSHRLGLSGRVHVTAYAGLTLRPRRGLARLFRGGVA